MFLWSLALFVSEMGVMRGQLSSCLLRHLVKVNPSSRSLVTLPKIVKVHEQRVQNKVLYPPFDIEIPKQTYTDFVWSGLEGHAHLPALVCGISGR